MSDTTENARGVWSRLPGKERRLLLMLALCLILGVLLLSWGRALPAAAGEAPQEETEAPVIAGSDQLQTQLEAILCQVKGAGNVRVAVWYSEGAAAVYATESENSSDRRTGQNEDQESRGNRVSVAAVNDRPVLVRQDPASVRGVLVVAEGAGDPQVRERLYAAVKSLLGLKTNQIAVIEGEGSDVL